MVAAILVAAAALEPVQAPPVEFSFTGPAPSAFEQTGPRRNIVLRADPQRPGTWSGRLHYEIGAGPMAIVKDGALSCRPAGTPAEGNQQ